MISALGKLALPLAIVVVLLIALVLSKPDLLRPFESFKFGSAEVKLRATTGPARKEAGQTQEHQTHRQANLDIWATGEYLKRAKLIAGLSSAETRSIDAFERFRAAVLEPVAILNLTLLFGKRIDLFDASPKVRLLIDRLDFVTTHRPDANDPSGIAERQGAFLVALDILRTIIDDASKRLALEGAAAASDKDISELRSQFEDTLRAIDRYTTWLNRLRWRDPQEMQDVLDSGYLVFLTYNLIDISHAADDFRNERSLTYLLKLFGSRQPQLIDIANLTGNPHYDFQSKLLIGGGIEAETQTLNSQEGTLLESKALYDLASGFSKQYLKAPLDQTKDYKPCEGIIDSDVLDLCQRIEFRTIPLLLKNILSNPAQNWVDGAVFEPALVQQLATYIEPLRTRADIIVENLPLLPDAPTLHTPRKDAEGIYYALLDTLAVSQLMTALELKGEIDEDTCGQVKFEIDQVIGYLEKTRDLVAGKPDSLLYWDQIKGEENRRRLAEQYCQ